MPRERLFTTMPEQNIYEVFDHQKTDLLLHLLEGEESVDQMMVYLRTREDVHALASKLNLAGFRTESLHGKQKVELRAQTWENFKMGKFPLLIVTDAVARPLDVSGVSRVLNFDFPELEADYHTRVAGTQNTISTFITPSNDEELEKLETSLEQTLTRSVADGFSYDAKEVKVRVSRNKTPKRGERSKPLQHKKKKWKPKKYTR